LLACEIANVEINNVESTIKACFIKQFF
jgi:hypothetical protein